MISSWKNLFFVAYRFNHHSCHSGYDKITDYGGSVIHANALPPGIVRNRLIWRLARGTRAYDREALATELKAGLSFLAHKEAIFHILYGEKTYHYLGLLNGIRSNRLIATFHLPPSVIRESVDIVWHLRQLSAVICVARNQIEFFESILGRERVVYIPHGIDTEHFTPPHSSSTRSPDHCLFVGDWLRDLPTLRGVIELVAFRLPSVKFTVVSMPKNQEYLGEHPNVEWKSGISEEELIDLYRQATLLVMPLRDATGNNALLEGMACGLPVVITDIGGVRDYVDSKSAVLIPPKDARAMAKEVLRLLKDPESRQALGSSARERAMKFSWPEIFEQLDVAYRSLG